LTDDLEHLTEEQRKQVLDIFPKDIKDLESTDEGVSKEAEAVKKPEVDIGLEKKSIEQVQDWKDGYIDYEKKTKESDRVVFEEGEIEVVEEDL